MFSAKITSKGDRKYHATTQHAQFNMASDGSSSKPADTLLASLCACLGYHVGEFLDQQKITYSDYTVGADSDLVPDQTRLADIHVTVKVTGEKLNQETASALLNHITRCYIHNTLKANSKITFKFAES